jgi:hypothetical protein
MPYQSATVYELPIFKPNQFLYDNFKSFGATDVEIYAEAVRWVMSEASGMPLLNEKTDLSDKRFYESEMKRIHAEKGMKPKAD